MQHRTWSALLVVVGLVQGAPAHATPSCADQLGTYDKWIAPIKSDVARGAVMSDRVDELVAIPLRAGSPPKQSAMTLVVDKAGLHDGAGPARPASQAAGLIEANTNLAFARTNKHAISHGILVFATLDAPAASVRAAVTAASAAHEDVWLVFRPSDGKAAAPGPSAVTKELGKLGSKDVSTLVGVIQRELGTCDGLMEMMRELGGQTESSRLPVLTDAPRPALAKCSCKPRPDVVASILWKLAFQNLGVLVPVPAASIAALPWGDGKTTWKDLAPAIVKALAR
jgi:hypothetical protein